MVTPFTSRSVDKLRARKDKLVTHSLANAITNAPILRNNIAWAGLDVDNIIEVGKRLGYRIHIVKNAKGFNEGYAIDGYDKIYASSVLILANEPIIGVVQAYLNFAIEYGIYAVWIHSDSYPGIRPYSFNACIVGKRLNPYNVWRDICITLLE